jgi:uncharacterized protein (DUF342 family)
MAAVLATGSASISINPNETEARLVFAPDPNGDGWDVSAINKLAADNNLGANPDQKAVETFLSKAGKAKNADMLEMVYAQGIPPENPVVEKVNWADLPVPAEMAAYQEDTLKKAGAPHVYRVAVEKIKHENKVKKPHSLIPGKEEVSVTWEKKETREEVDVDPKILEVKYAAKGTVLGTLVPPVPGKNGKSVFGRPIPPESMENAGFLLGNGIAKEKNELVAQTSGFIRIGDRWADLVPLAKHTFTIAKGADGLTLFFSFEPGDKRFPLPTGEQILSEAVTRGAAEESLVSAKELDNLIGEAIKTGEAVEAFSLFNLQEAEARVDISPDKTRAALYLRKGVAGAQPLEMKTISQAIKDSGVHGFDSEKLKTAIHDFMESNEIVLPEYVLVEGASSTRGADREVKVSVEVLPEEGKKPVIVRLKDWYSRDVSGAPELNIDDSINLAFVENGQVIAKVSEGSEGKDGKDIFGNVIPGLPGNDPELKLLAGMELHGSEIKAACDGLLLFRASEKSFIGEVIVYRDAKIGIHISEDAMEVKGDFFLEAGPGIPITIENVKKVIASYGIKRGVDWIGLEKACAHTREHGSILGHIVARGENPIAQGGSAVNWLVPLDLAEISGVDNTGNKTVQVKAGNPIAVLSEAMPSGRPGFDVTGREIPIEKAEAGSVGHDKSIREVPHGKGKRLLAARSGELSFDGKMLKILPTKTIKGDVNEETGKIKFSGEVKISGNVLSGGMVVAGSHITVDGYAEEAMISSGGKATVTLGFKGGGKGILKARAGISASFIERAFASALGDVQLKKGSILSNIKTNGKLSITSENGKLSGGICQARLGIDAADIGSEKGLRTEISFGQDYFIKEQIGECEDEIVKINSALVELEEKITLLRDKKQSLPEDLRIEKIRLVKLLEQEKLKLFNLREKFEEHSESEINCRGTVFPGVVIESHNRYYEVQQKRNQVIFYFDRDSGRIKEKPLGLYPDIDSFE